MEEQNQVVTAIEKLLDKAIQKLDEKFETRFETLEKRFEEFHRSQIKLEGLRSDFQFFAEDLKYVKGRIEAWDAGDENESSIPARVSALEIRVTRLEKKKGRG